MQSSTIRGTGSPTLHALVRIAGDVDRADAAALARLPEEVRGVVRLHVDLSGVRHASLALVSWLIDLRRQATAVGGRMTLDRVPKSFERLLVALGLGAKFDIAGCAGDVGTDTSRTPERESALV
jgi:ABC-type transporter Mla MlaB component